MKTNAHISDTAQVLPMLPYTAAAPGTPAAVRKARSFRMQVRFAGIDCSGAALDMAKAALLGSCEGLAARNITLVCQEYTQGVHTNQMRCQHPAQSACMRPTCNCQH